MGCPPDTRPPYAIIAQQAFGSYLRTMRIPEDWIPRVQAHGWLVLIKDSDMPRGQTGPMDMNLLSGPTRYDMEDDEAHGV